MTATTTYTEAQIAEARDQYAEFHGVEAGDVDVCRTYAGDSDAVVGFRLSLDADGHQHGKDEKYGDC